MGLLPLILLVILSLNLPSIRGQYLSWSSTSSVAIPDLKTGTSSITTSGCPISTIPGSTSGNLLVQLNIDITHTYPGDLVIIVCDPSQYCSYVGQRDGGTCDAYYVNRQINDNNVGFRIGSSYSCSSLPTAMSPDDPYGFQVLLATDQTNGVWQLIAEDEASGDSGTIVSWSVVLLNPCFGTNPCGSHGTCVSTGWASNAYTCTCAAGWTGTTDCNTNINECTAGTANCASGTSTCTDTQGSFTCACNTGYSGNGVTCTNINECTAGTSNCASGISTCTDTVGSFTCACNAGYSGNGVTCTNINECAGSNSCATGGTSTCTDTIGSYTCACNTGYTGNGYTCTDVNECLGTNHCNAANGTCTNTAGSYTCACKSGFSGDGITCVDINECSVNATACDTTKSICQNTIGSYQCICNNGITQPGVCIGYDFCGNATLNNCSSNALCTNMGLTFTCACKSGYSGNGYVCTNINECLTPNICDPHANCTDYPGTYTCTCNSGYYASGNTCLDYDECSGQNGGNLCSPNALCTNIPGNYTCACKSGFSGDGHSCTDNNECSSGTTNTCNTVTGTCINTPGSYSCACNSGYAGDGRTCILVAIPTVTDRQSNSISLSWTIAANADYVLHIQNTSNFQTNVTLGTGSSYTFDCPPNSVYTFILYTWVLSDQYYGTQQLSVTSKPAALTGVSFVSVTYHSYTFSFTPSAGASSYTYTLFNSSGSSLTSGGLSTSGSGSLTGVIDNLQGNTNYQAKVFAGEETVGYLFSFTTAPLPIQSLIARRHDDTSVSLSWTASPGSTRYVVDVTFPNNTFVATYNPSISVTDVTYIIANLVNNVTYQYTIYAGNAFGIDLVDGVSGQGSTQTLFCNQTTEANATWDLTSFQQTTYGHCIDGFGGKPYRTCLDSGGGSDGIFGPIQGICTKIPDPLPHAPTVDPYSSDAIITWKPQADCYYFRATVVNGDIEISLNNGEGSFLQTPTIDMRNLSPKHPYTVKVYCGNVGGFETTGRTVTFTTNIPVPSGFALGAINDTAATLSWAADAYATWYYVEYAVAGNGRKSTPVLVDGHLTKPTVTITGLKPSTSYDVRVYSGQGEAHEPHGSVTRVKTLSENGNSNAGSLSTGALIGIIVGVLVVAAAVVAIIGIFVYRQHRRTKQLSTIISQELSLNAVNPISGKPSLTSQSLNRRGSTSSRKSDAVAEATLLNTTMEISVPGFLLLDSNRQFRIEGPLGAGGAATVFRGILLDKDLVSQHNTRDVALKRVEKHPRISLEENKDRFLQEVSIMWSCTFHQNVVKLVGYTLEPDYYIITRLYPIDLFTLIHHPDETIAPLLALKLAGDIASAMSYMQDTGIIHRDLKSSNVLLEVVPIDATQSVLRAVICDFGLARVASDAHTISGQKFKEIGGFSPRYAAPEVFAASSNMVIQDVDIDRKSDVYSFAIILWEMIVRKIPWDGLKREQIEAKVRGGVRPELPVDYGTDPALSIIIDMTKVCWTDNPATRPSFGQIIAKISSLL